MRTVIWLHVGCLTILPALATFAAPPGSPRIDDVQLLPYQGWEADPDVIWYDDFDGSDDLLSRYLEYSSDGGDFRPVTYEALGGVGKSLRGIFQRREVSAGGIKKCFGRNPMDYRGLGVRNTEDFREIYWRQYVKMQPGWIGNPAKLNRAIAFAGSNWSEAMIAHIWGGHSNNLCIDPASGVNANSQVVTTKYNDFANLTWLGSRPGTSQIFDTDESGRWISIEGHVRLNTPGESDGIFTLYIDEQVEASRNDLNWVYSWDDYGINAVFLENYWNSGSPVTQERYFDDFVISTSYIGLARSPYNPLVTKTGFRDSDPGDEQAAWQLQIAWNADGTDLVWDSGIIEDSGNAVAVTAANGSFQGSLAGRHELAPGHLYALRTRQRDSNDNWSAWSPWTTTLRTGTLTPGDGNGDGLIDEVDLGLWQQNADPLGTEVNTFAMGDWNGDGLINGSDLALWQQNYDPIGPSAGIPVPPGTDAGSTVPEPSTGMMAICVTLAVMMLRRRRARTGH